MQELSTYVMPYDRGIEEAILGAVMLDKDAFHLISSFLFPDAFGYTPHGYVWQAFAQLQKDGFPIDLLTVTNKLKESGKLEKVGGPFQLVEMTNRVASAANIEFHARIILQKWIRRQIIKISHQNLTEAQDDSVDSIELLSKAQLHLMQISGFLAAGAGTRVPELVDNILDQCFNPSAVPIYLEIGIRELDTIMTGLIPGELCIVAGRPGSGKTTLALTMIVNLIKAGVPCAFFTYEMTPEELMKKIISTVAEIESYKFRKPELLTDFDKQALRAASNTVKKWGSKLQIIKGSGMNATQLRSKMISIRAQYDIQVCVVDYLQLMPNIPGWEKKSTHDALGETTRIMKETADETKMSVIALSQLAKETEKNKWAKPKLSNLRDSGKLEDNADRVLFVWRPEYHDYYIVEDNQGTEIHTVGKACVIQAKFRHGEPGEAWIRAKLEYSKFTDIDGDLYAKIEDIQWIEIKTPTVGNSQNNQFSQDLPF